MIALHCIVCKEPIPAERCVRKAVTCSDECKRLYGNQRRQNRAATHCRLCGRRFKAKRSQAPPESQESLSGAVLTEHTVSGVEA